MFQPTINNKTRFQRLIEAARSRLGRASPGDDTAGLTRETSQIAETFDVLSLLKHDAVVLKELKTPIRIPLWHRLSVRNGAASIATMVMLGGLGLYHVVFAPTAFDTKVGEQRMVTLADGSRVTLNTDTHITVRINAHQRQIDLTSGEAFFDVAKIKKGPAFVIHSGATDIRVTGTRFNVRSTDNEVRVDVEEGRVLAGVNIAHQDQGAVVLNANQAASLDKAGLLKYRSQAENVRIENWRQGRVYFSGTALRTAVAEMNRYNQTHIEIDSSSLGDVPISGVFRADATESFAQALVETYNLDIKPSGRVIKISSKHVNPE